MRRIRGMQYVINTHRCNSLAAPIQPLFSTDDAAGHYFGIS